jgi:hypothetical protein
LAIDEREFRVGGMLYDGRSLEELVPLHEGVMDGKYNSYSFVVVRKFGAWVGVGEKAISFDEKRTCR